MNQSEHSCCENSADKGFSVCKECCNIGKSIKEITIRSFVKESKLEAIKNPDGFYFCETSTCQCVYFNNVQQIYLHKEDIKVSVGIKETEGSIPVCYCFNWTKDRIFDQIKQQEYSTVIQEITTKVKAGECSCEIKNPSGKCCLGEVNKMIKNGMELYSKGGEKI